VSPLLKKQRYWLQVAIAANLFLIHYETVFLIQAVNSFSEVGINPVKT